MTILERQNLLPFPEVDWYDDCVWIVSTVDRNLIPVRIQT